MNAQKTAYLLLRAGVALAFLYPPVSALFEPTAWIGYFPSFTRGFMDETLMLHAFGAVEVVLALWILSGWKIVWPSLTAAALLTAIVIFNPQEFPILFRDLSIAMAALALAISRPILQE
ncbi:MAG: hypothetical protein AAB449_02110 [Patescibacteria group bacterium]